MQKMIAVLALPVCVTVLLSAAPRQVDARPTYHKAFVEKYEAVAEQAKELKCGVCHGDGGKKKDVLSDYGKALKEALNLETGDGGKVVPEKDLEKIKAAMEKIESKDAGDGKTFGDLLKAGKLPPAAE